MFDSVRDNKRVVQIILLLLVLPFAFFGVESYFHDSGVSGEMAKVGKGVVTPQEFEMALRQQEERLREAAGKEFDPKMLQSPEVRHGVLDGLVNRRLLSVEARERHMQLSDAQLGLMVSEVPAFQENGKFSEARLDQIAKAQGYTREGLVALIREDATIQQLYNAVSASAFVPKALASTWARLQQETRDVSEASVLPFEFQSQVKVSPEQVQKYYDANPKQFEVAEQVKVEYLVLDEPSLAEQTSVSDAEVRKLFEENQSRFMQGEERRASHILIQVAADAPEAKRKEARARIDALLKQVKAKPKLFDKLAKDNSEDPGSKDNGGDLGFFGRGSMVKAFEDAAFALKPGEISGVVETDYGYHIIRLTEVKGGQGKTLDQARPEIVADLKRDAAKKKYSEIAEGFSNLVYEQADSLQPAADKFGLKLQQSALISKDAPPAPFNNKGLLNALFSADALKEKRNTPAIETAPNTLVSARVVEYVPARLRAFEEVKAQIEKQLVMDESVKLAQQRGKEQLDALKKGENPKLEWSPSRTVNRAHAQGPALALVKAIFSAPADKLPAYVGIDSPSGGYVIFRIDAIKQPEKDDAQRAEQIRARLTQRMAQDDFTSYIIALRERHPVKLNEKLLNDSGEAK